jgi:hypothetical protein
MGLAWVTVVWRWELGMLVNWTDILDGAIANAAWGVVSMVAQPRTARRVAAALDTAAWADTERLIRDALAGMTADPGLPDLSEAEAEELKEALKRDEAQGALRTLLACRLTDAPETDAAKARMAVRLALRGKGSPVSEPRPLLSERELEAVADGKDIQKYWQHRFGRLPLDRFDRLCGTLSGYLDDRTCGLVATLEGRVGFEGLGQVRAEAYNARIVALLGAIERQVGALADPDRNSEAEAEWLARYRRQAHQRHGFLTPPDFDRRRRVPAADIYVPAQVSRHLSVADIADMIVDQYPAVSATGPGDHQGQAVAALPAEPDGLRVLDLVGKLDRTVLLGDPGGGKTTAANILTDHFASGSSRRVPFLVTLREYAAKAPIEWSVAEHVEQNLKTVYQSGAPDGLVERLMLTGRAIVIFDGLDELLDTSRRRDVSDRVEQFCLAYPLTPVLVTSRLVGYDQARLDDSQFTCYRLGGFGDAEVAEYARKWFATQDDTTPAQVAVQADAFLAESANAKDLRANPLLLSLMCILYRGAGSLPGDRAGIYARCAELLLRKWDEQRDLYRKLRFDHLVEPTLRHLAWWLYTREDSHAVATERELATKAGEFLLGRGYETEDEAQAAARELVAFCRGRMWVFSDAGTTASGKKLYGFTHRTFLEYFAAWHLVVTSESPEELAHSLLPRIYASSALETVGELAVKLKSDTIDRGADRVCAALLDQQKIDPYVLRFLVRCMESARPSPMTTRRLTRALLDYAIRDMVDVPNGYKRAGGDLLSMMLHYGNDSARLVFAEMTDRMAAMAASADRATQTTALRFIVESSVANQPAAEWAADQIALYATAITAEARLDLQLRQMAHLQGCITLDQMLEMPNGLSSLAQEFMMHYYSSSIDSYLESLCWNLETKRDVFSELTAIGRYVLEHPKLPWARVRTGRSRGGNKRALPLPELDEVSGLGAAAAYAITAERAMDKQARMDLSAFPMPTKFVELFREWVAGRVDFVEVIEE